MIDQHKVKVKEIYKLLKKQLLKQENSIQEMKKEIAEEFQTYMPTLANQTLVTERNLDTSIIDPKESQA